MPTDVDNTQSELLNARTVARFLAISERHFWKMHAIGQLPAPVRLGRSVRWRRAELLAWLNAGCPSRDDWEAMQGADR